MNFDIKQDNIVIEKEIADFALNLISSCFQQDDLNQVSFCLAGGCFKNLILNQNLHQPRDLDIFPCSDIDRQKLIEICGLLPSLKPFKKTEWNTKFYLNNSRNEEIIIEIVNRTDPPNLIDKLSYFDLAISRIGVEFTKGKISQVYYDPEAIFSIEKKQILMKIPMPNEPFLLATAERVLRYAKEFNFGFPIEQIEFLLERYVLKTKETQEKLKENYLRTTLFEDVKAQVDSLFSLTYQTEKTKNFAQNLIVFQKGCPMTYCRRYLPSELDEMIEQCVNQIPVVLNSNNKQAILVSGLPGAGKSSSINKFIADKTSFNDFVIIDDEIIRGFHKQFIYELKGMGEAHYKGLLKWFMEGVDYDKTIFQNENSMFNKVIKRNQNFMLSGVLDNEGCFKLINYTLMNKYYINFIFVYVPYQIAVRRARARANLTGRWTSRKFIESRVKSIYFWTIEIAKFIMQNKGVVIIYDNSLDGEDPIKIFDSEINDLKQFEIILENMVK